MPTRERAGRLGVAFVLAKPVFCFGDRLGVDVAMDAGTLGGSGWQAIQPVRMRVQGVCSPADWPTDYRSCVLHCI